MKRLIPVALLVIVIGAWLLIRRSEPARTSLSVSSALSGDTTGYARALGPRTFSFPLDHGPHPDYKTEWWYFTGNLTSAGGDHFGYQLTLFRTALAPPDSLGPVRSSDWATRQLYMGHFALTDVAGGRYRSFERFARGGAGLAGARAEPFRVWLENWSLDPVGAGVFPLRLVARAEDVSLDVVVSPARPIVFQGDRGYDRKGAAPGDASYYYSITRLETKGRIRTGDRTLDVSGLSWLDREWSTSVLSEEQEGWDWFSLQLSDGRDLMYYQIRKSGGAVSRYSDGMLLAPGLGPAPISREDVRLDVLDTWRSRRTGATYPARWKLSVPDQAIDIEIRPYLADQEFDGAIQYWEGAVRIAGTSNGRPVSGNGYVEMTGYGATMGSRGAPAAANRPAEPP